MILNKSLYSLFLLFFSVLMVGQNDYQMEADDHSVVIDQTNKVIVWQTEDQPFQKKLRFNNETYSLLERTDSLRSTQSYALRNRKATYQLYITKLPVISVKSKDSIVNEPKRPAEFTLKDKDTLIEALIGIELRGNSALKYPKKSYDLEIWEDTTSQKSRDIKIAGLRDDDDWILNSLYNEPIKLRSQFSNNLWLSMQKGRTGIETRGRAGIKSKYVELFLNDTYQGIYLLSEQVDRKLLKLEKMESDVVHGVLYKANSYAGNTSFTGIKPMNNNLPTWDGFEMEYPFENYESHWEPVYNLVSTIVNSDDTQFKAQISMELDINNAIDYFILVNVLRATDNLGKNYFLARTNKQSPFYFVPWDLDGVLGSIQDGKRIPTTNDILSNGLFDRLLELNPDSYRSNLKSRWIDLRENLLSDQSLETELHKIYNQFDTQKVYERDLLIWSPQSQPVDDLEYAANWLRERLVFLDTYFNSLD